jgi:hypothetical protein
MLSLIYLPETGELFSIIAAGEFISTLREFMQQNN